MIRQPAVAGFFYPGNRDELKRQLAAIIPDREKSDATAIVVPHAGYMYSGSVAGEVYGSVELPQRFVILCPNHTGQGSDFDLHPEGEWLTPLGSARVDSELCRQLLERFPYAVQDGRAHAREHSLEVQLPFLQVLKQDFSFLPLCIRPFRFDLLEELAKVIVTMVQESPQKIMIIASSDMTHYESQQLANQKDRLAIDQMKNIDARGLFETVHRHNISMCGVLPATVALLAAKQLGASQGNLVKYATSGDVTHDYDSVVGYAGMVIH